MAARRGPSAGRGGLSLQALYVARWCRYETRSFAPPAAREARGQTGAKVGFKRTFTLRQHLRSASFTAPLPHARCYCPAFSAFATATRTCQRIWCHAVVGREARPLLSTPGSAARGVEQIEMGMPHRGQLALQRKPCQMMLLQKAGEGSTGHFRMELGFKASASKIAFELCAGSR